MPKSASCAVLQALLRAVDDQRVKELSDQDLLRRFVDRHDEAAFCALMRRHGPMVLSVCHALLSNEADAEDAFQATFLVFADKAWSIRKTAALGSWLHGVAYRTARKAQAAFARRRKHERLSAKPEASPPSDLSWREVQELLHEELNGISARYRSALTLCYLEGMTLEAAAAQLGFAKTTLKARLERGRALLRARLVRRGLGPPALLAVAVWPASAQASLPVGLLQVTAKAALSMAAGHAATGLVSAKVSLLTKGVLNAMAMSKVKVLTAALLLLTGLGFSLAGLLYPTGAQEAGPEQAALPAPVQKVAKATEDALALEPKELAVLRGHTNIVWSVALTPDGKTLVSASFDKTVKVWDVAKGKESATLRGHRTLVDFAVITPDGKTVASADQDGVIKLWDLPSGKERADLATVSSRIDVVALATGGRVLTGWTANSTRGVVKQWDLVTGRELGRLKHPGPFAAAISPDGKLLAQRGLGIVPTGVRLLTLPSGSQRVAWKEEELPGEPVVFSSDSKTLFTIDHKAEAIHLWEVATGKLRLTIRNAPEKYLHEIAIHPAGRVMALAHKKECNAVKLWDLVTGLPMAHLKVDNHGIDTVAFSADGSTLAAASRPDTAIHVWDVRGFRKPPPPRKEKLSDRELDVLWADLAGDDASKAYQAIWTLAESPKQALPWIGKQLLPVVAAAPQQTTPLIAALGDDHFAVRDKATRDLEKLGEAAAPALHTALTSAPSAEARQRIETLLAKMAQAQSTPDQLRTFRVIEALERAGTIEARLVLEALAKGVPQASRTSEAKASLERIVR